MSQLRVLHDLRPYFASIAHFATFANWPRREDDGRTAFFGYGRTIGQGERSRLSAKRILPSVRQVYAEVAAEVANGGRAFIIYPLIEESSAERLENIRAAEEEHAKLQASGVLGAGVATGLLHGRMATEEKQAAVQRFVSGETPVLVSTTLVEVGPFDLTFISSNPVIS